MTIFRAGRTGAWWMYLVAGHLLLGLYYLIPVSPAGTTGQTVRVVLYCTISASAAIVWVRMSPPPKTLTPPLAFPECPKGELPPVPIQRLPP